MNDHMEQTVVSPKNTVFQLRMNKDVKDAAEELFSRCGLTLSDALNLFIQQSLNHGGIPFEISGQTRKMTMEEAVQTLLSELEKGVVSGVSNVTTNDLKERYSVE